MGPFNNPTLHTYHLEYSGGSWGITSSPSLGVKAVFTFLNVVSMLVLWAWIAAMLPS